MYDQQAVDRMRSEITALKLELATLHSAFREIQYQPFDSAQGKPRRTSPVIPTIEPPVRPTIYPAAIVVLAAASLLTWRLITTPHVKVDQPVPAAPIAAINPIAPPAPPVTPRVRSSMYRGTLSVKADHPGATVFVNHRNMGPAPVRVRNLRAGAHLVWVESEGYRRWTRVVTVPAEQVTQVSADLEPIVENTDGPGM